MSTLKEHVSTFGGVVQVAHSLLYPPYLFSTSFILYDNSSHYTQKKETPFVDNHLIVSVSCNNNFLKKNENRITQLSFFLHIHH